MKRELRESLFFFGYVTTPGQEHATPFFDYDDANEEDMARFAKFKELNKAALAACAGKAFDGKVYRCNKEVQGIWTTAEWQTLLSLPAKLQIKEHK